MANQIVVHKGRTVTITVNLGMDVSSDTFTSQIRTQPNADAPLIAEWDVDFASDGTDGTLLLTLDNTVTSQISEHSGYMDIKRQAGSEPVPVFDRPLEVIFRGSVTA